MSLSLISKHDSSLTVSNRGRRKEIHIMHVSNFSGHAWRTINSLCKGLMGLFPTLRNECELSFSWHKKTQPRPKDLMSLAITTVCTDVPTVQKHTDFELVVHKGHSAPYWLGPHCKVLFYTTASGACWL